MTSREQRAMRAMELWIHKNSDFVLFEMECKSSFLYKDTLYTSVRFRRSPFDPWLLGVTDALFAYDDRYNIYPVITYSRFEPYKKNEAKDDALHLVHLSLLKRKCSLYYEYDYYDDWDDY